MKINPLPSTRMALQAAISVAIASGLGAILPIERPYWAILTAMFLISQTWGESIKKAVERIIMTIAGGAVGTLLYYLAKDHQLLCLSFMMISVFFTIYFIETSYLITVFFLTIFVVFLFAILQGWNTHLLITRIYETVLGAFIALITSALFFSIRTQHRLESDTENFLRLIGNAIAYSCNIIYQKKPNLEKLKSRHVELVSHYMELQKNIESLQYENLFKAYPQKKLKQIVMTFNLTMHYTTSILETAHFVANVKERSLIHNEISSVKKALKNNLKVIATLLAGKKNTRPFIDIEHYRLAAREIILSKNIANLPEPVRTERFELHSFFYFFIRINQTLAELVTLLK